MEKEMNPSQYYSKSKASSMQIDSTRSHKESLSTTWIQFITVLALSIAWGLLSVNSGGLFLKEILISGAIINALMFFRASSKK